jgi:hypothetical protein
MTSIGKRIPLIASIAFQAFSVKALSIDKQAAYPSMRHNQPARQGTGIRTFLGVFPMFSLILLDAQRFLFSNMNSDS